VQWPAGKQIKKVQKKDIFLRAWLRVFIEVNPLSGSAVPLQIALIGYLFRHGNSLRNILNPDESRKHVFVRV
jgi:hypothetical protein